MAATTFRNRVMRLLAGLFTLALLVALLIPLATRATRAESSNATTAPVITDITGVQEGQSISGSVVIEAKIAGDQSVKVTFRLSGPQQMSHTDRTFPYYFMGDQNGVPKSWDTTTFPDGDYTLKVTATDVADQRSTLTRHFQIANGTSTAPSPNATPTMAPATPPPVAPTNTPTVQPQPTAPSTTPTAQPQPTAPSATPTAPPTAQPTAQPTTPPAPTATPQAPVPTGNVYYVATNGNDANTGTEAQPFRTLNKGASVLKPGDTLLVKPGSYSEGLIDAIPSGMDWNKPVTIKAYDPNNRPILVPTSGRTWVLHFQTYQGQVVHHIIVDGFVLDAKNVTYDAVKITMGAHHIRLINSEVRNSPNQGILTSGVGSDYNEFISLDVHDNGIDTQFDHGMYISTSANLIDGCLVHHNAGYGIHFYSEDPAYKPNNNIARNNRLYDGQGRHGGMIISVGDGNLAYNNLLYNTPTGIEVAYDASNSKVYNNVIYGLTGGTAGAWNGIGIYIDATGASNSIYDNISTNNSGAGIRNDASGNTLIKNNLTYQNSQDIATNGAATVSGNIAGRDPLFADPANYDFHITAESPAIDVGLTLPEVSVDQDNVSRPQGTTSDIGAYEYRGP
jgi:hypothetical protein